MKNSHNFMLKYEGAALADSTMDVAQLAPALISLSRQLPDVSYSQRLEGSKKTINA